MVGAHRMWRIFSATVLLTCASAVVYPLPASGVDLAGATVVIESDASHGVGRAAEEFARYAYLVTGNIFDITPCAVTNGVQLRIKAGGNASGPARSGFSICSGPDSVTVTGFGEKGCLYGVYEILERFCGVRWYSSRFEKVPRSRHILIPDGIEITQEPDFPFRGSLWYDVSENPGFSDKLRFDMPKFGKELSMCHTFDNLCPAEKYFDSHPEYFSYCGGKRLKETTQLCLTNDDVLRIATSNVLENIRKNPQTTFFGVSQNDNRNYCTCPECSAVDAEEGSPSGTLLRFVNRIAEKVALQYPHVYIQTLAYQYTRRPPAKTKPAGNVIVCLCTFECDFAHPLSSGLDHENRKFKDDIRKWSRICENLHIWDYVTNFRHYPSVFPNIAVMAENVRFFRANSVEMLFMQGAYQGNGAYMAEYKAWLASKLLWDADCNEKELRDDFFNGFYGKSAHIIMEDVEEACSHYAERPFAALSINDPLNLVALPDGYFERSLKRMEKALKIAQDDPLHADNVRAWALSVVYTALFRVEMAMEEGERKPEDVRNSEKFARWISDYIAEPNWVRFSETSNKHRISVILSRAGAAGQSLR